MHLNKIKVKFKINIKMTIYKIKKLKLTDYFKIK